MSAEVDTPEFDFVTADRVDEDRLRLLDGRLCQDVPGTGRGRTEVVAEFDDANVASTALLESLGARRTGGSIELIRR